jgi:hypothetical protein
MKKRFMVFCLAFMPFLMNSVFAQDTIIAWTFPSTSADKYADAGISGYLSRYISCQYGYLAADTISINYTTAGFPGLPDKCAMATGWTNNLDSANWMVKFITTGYGSLKLYSKQMSDATNPGPRDFKVQYKLPGANPWVDLTGGTITCANDWTTGVVNGIDLPVSCNGQNGKVGIRWMVTSQLDINGNALLSTGISKIDNIVVTGIPTAGINEPESGSLIRIYPNPNNGNFCIEYNSEINKISVYNILGKCMYTNEKNIESRIDLSGFEEGIYLVQITTKDNEILTRKLIVE